MATAMNDDFYYEDVLQAQSAISHGNAAILSVFGFIYANQVTLAVTVISAIASIVVLTRFLSDGASVSSNGAKSVSMRPYWVPFVGHLVPFIQNPLKLLREARDVSPHGIFALRLGPTTHNIISNPGLVKNVMQQKESAVQFQPIAWTIVHKVFGVPSKLKTKYLTIWDELCAPVYNGLMSDPELGTYLNRTVGALQRDIPSMFTFLDSPIDQQPWERVGRTVVTSESPQEVEVDLMTTVSHMLGHASVPAIFGNAFLEKFPQTLEDVFVFDKGFNFLVLGLPRWFPIPTATRAYIARYVLNDSLQEFSTALDAYEAGEDPGSGWGEMDDVSDMIRKRNAIYRSQGLAPKERFDLSLLWALVVNANVFVYWHILFVLSTPGLLDRIRKETEPYAQVTPPESINGYKTAPSLKLMHLELTKNCPLFKSSYLETLRIVDQAWSVRQTSQDIVISQDKQTEGFRMKKGDYVTIPHDLHMMDPAYFPDPEKFDPERFLVEQEDGSLKADIGTARPYGGGPSMCKGRVYAERECMAFVAGVLALWDIEPVDPEGWKIPAQKKQSAISLPTEVTRVRIRPRVF